MSSQVFQTSGFPIFTIIWLEEMVAMKTVYGRIKVFEGFRLFVDGHVKDLKYHDLISDGTGKQTGYCYFQFKVILNERS